jgi:hypothetical protein
MPVDTFLIDRCQQYLIHALRARVQHTEQMAGDQFGFEIIQRDATTQQIVAQMRSFIALGVDSFLLDCGGFPNLTTLELLVHEVLPLMVKATV